MVAYIDDYYLMAWLCLAAVPLALLMLKNTCPAGLAPADAAGH